MHGLSERQRLIPLLMVLTLLVVSALSVRSASTELFTKSQRYEDTYYLPPAEWLELMTLDYQEAAADLLWIKSLLYFGEEMVHRGQTRYIYGYLDAMLTLDPDFRAAYLWASVAGLYRSGNVTPADGYKVVQYLERAVNRWPDDGELAWELGATLRFELAPLVHDPAEKQRLYEAAMEPLSTAARLGAGPPYLAGLNAQLLAKLGRNELAIRHLEEMYDTIKSPFEREQMRFQLIKLRSERYATAFQSANDELRNARVNNFPYLESNLFLLVGERIASRRDSYLARGFIPNDEGFQDNSDAETEAADIQAHDESGSQPQGRP